ncbi:MAG: hypothetical protein GDA44_07390 [Prochloron sp. SP5CPC1]|nr:hypothetical protein [Candidatus Paraprochloron terpiosi SP5CPC1]
MSTVDVWLANHCPNLFPDQYQIISPKTSDYNCIAWAAEEDDRWWDPTDPYGYWLDEVPRELTLAAFIKLYQMLGYESCDSAKLEPGWQRVAIYTRNNGDPDDAQPTHVARQLPNGRWTSKIGELEDIEHELNGLRGFYYGKVTQILKRPINT